MLLDVATKWVRSNCPNPVLCRDFIGRLEAAEEKKVNCSFALGAALTRSGKPVLVHCYSGQLFVFHLTRAQAERLDAVQALMHYTEYGERQDVDAAAPVSVTLDELEIENASSLNNADPIQGRCTYSLRGFWLEPFALRLEYELTGRATVSSWDSHLEGLVQPDGVFRFSFSPIRNLSENASQAWTGTTAAFLRLYTMPNPMVTAGRKPLSNACAALIDVH